MIIYKHYTQNELDNQYNNRLHVPDFATYLHRWEELNKQVQNKYDVVKNITYGDLSRESLDVFSSSMPNSKTLVFIHGGYWQRFDKSDFHFIASAFNQYDVTTVFINYPLAPDAAMDEIVASCRKAMLWLHQNIASLNGDPDKLHVVGHSAGANLATMLMEKEWVKNNVADFIKGVCALSGIFNLEPVRLSNINAVLNMSKEMVLENSPVLLTPAGTCPLVLCVGEDETTEFKCQTMELYNKWKNKNNFISLLQLPNINHFSIVETLLNKHSPLHLAMCKLMGI